MKIIQILPELDIGGVNATSSISLTSWQREGHDVMVISNGGQMQGQLSGKVTHRKLLFIKKTLLLQWAHS